ncbi:MerR family transcriptional regulator [Kribbella qitaiheensis]|uniref:MerR family transcriptional regulator n=1 Tax=Kribbella qitaiheensis TaxID=1544730 RepID=A0A7G6WYI9_9ACTN|nr:MerR family transcriptional regulator [Kribbella qitaiheensis]QNE19054.1 MerR family transcriptional regulator [Kribbella qitaiheensis]
MSLRPVDLAREAGISAQLVRNYEAEGILPPALRSESGYRRYEQAHLAALRAFRALAPGFGREAATEIMRAVHAGDNGLALRVVDASHAALHAQRLATDEMSEALGAAAEQFLGPQVAVAGPPLLVGELAAQLGVRAATLRLWESAGLLMPSRERSTKYRRYGPPQVRDARIIAMLRRGRYGFDQIRPVLEGLRRTGSTEALRAAVAERRAAHDRRTRAMLHGAALLDRYLTGLSQGEWDEAGSSDS